jgi:outer membrane protein assembly factor BamB
MTAYDATTGEVQWTLPRETEDDPVDDPTTEEDESPWLESGGFMAAPIGYGDLVLVPVNNGGAISIYAIDPKQQGKTVWKSFLCDEPETGAAPWSAINLSIDGSDLFVNCGMGVVFVLDPATGTVRFAKRYQRVGKPDDFQRRSGWTVKRLNFTGWSSDLVIPYGRQMICFSSDNDAIEAYDRNNGSMIWRSEMSPIGFKVDYVLGVYNDMLYAAGKETIVAYDLEGEGRMIWGADQLFDGKQSLGRGVLTPDGIFMPVEDSIYHFDLAGDKGKAKVLAKVQVDLGTEAPVGNLYCDGQRFWVHGANRLYALGPKE